MCYYVDQAQISIEFIEEEFNVKYSDEKPNDHFVVSGFSHPKMLVVTAEKSFRLLRWGLIPSWVKDWEAATKLRTQTLNAISETAGEKPSFRGAVNAGRFCIVPVNGFYEWHHHTNGNKYPHYIFPKGKSLFFLAGLYEQWTNKAIGEVHDTFTILTTNANQRMEWIHNSKKRMPVIMSANDAHTWLDRGLSFEQKITLLAPYPESLMSDHSISKLITSRKENPNVPEVRNTFNYPELSPDLFSF